MTLPEPELITDPDQLEDLADLLRNAPRIAVDTESNSLHAYREQVCLLQFSVPEGDFLVDPLVLPDIDALGPVFASSQIEKIFHAAEYDLICLQRDFGFRFANLFDTQIAVRILGWKRVGLGNILEEKFGLKPNKRYQRADWKRRPLPEDMMQYAQLDTHFLIELRDQLEPLLTERGLIELAREDFKRACEVTEVHETGKNGMCWRVNGSHELTPQQMAVLQELCRYRDGVARRLDRPLFKVIPDRVLVELARHCPFDINELGEIDGVHSWLLRNHGRDLLAAVGRGLKSDPLEPPRTVRPASSYLARMDTMHAWRKETARKMGVESDVVLPRNLLEAVVRENPRDKQSLAPLLDETPWRMDQFGGSILAALNGSDSQS
ncbi:MAG TPA: HRDC domain-containing protein [Anaerolineales bacterium]|nr:HRDC domain-containing protein [Anaerolineales bacterium]